MYDTRVASARQVLSQYASPSSEEQIRFEESFFKSICLPNGTHKTTATARLADVDRVLCSYFDEGADVKLLDVGMSFGVTTIELVNEFESRGIRISGVGADICVRAYLWSLLGVDLLLDPAGHVLQVATPFFARGRPALSQRSLKSKILALVLDCLESSLIRKWLVKSRRSRALSLVSPRLLGRDGFTVAEHDVGLPMPLWHESFDVVRAANILNLDYFSPCRIRDMITNMVSWLKKDGLLLVCRTLDVDGSNHASLYRRRDTNPYLELVHRHGSGSEIESLINEMACHISGKSWDRQTFVGTG